MPDEKIEFRRFHRVTIAVPDFDAAVADWTDRLGWPPATSGDGTATFALDDASIELVAAGDASPGVTSVSVVVDDVAAAAGRLQAKGTSVVMTPEGHARVDPSSVNGVPLELRSDDGLAAPGAAGAGGGSPYRRFNHIVVAVADDEAAKAGWADLFGPWIEAGGHAVEAVHHVPVGIAWFGLTGSGTDATALAKFVERRGEGVYALAVVIDDHPASVAALESRGAQIIRQESSGQTFVHPRTSHGVLIDLVPERHPSRTG